VKRLITEDISSFERELLEEAMHERPQLATRRRMAIALGLSPLLVYTSAAKALVGTALGKLGLGVLVGASALALQVAPAFNDAEPDADTLPVFAQAVSPERSSVAAKLAQSNNDGTASSVQPSRFPRMEALGPSTTKVEEAPKVDVRRQLRIPALPAVPPVEQAELVKPKPIVRRSARKRAAKSTLAEEVALLDRARGFVNSGRSALALSVLDDYRRKFPNGILARESLVLRRRAVGGHH
jgi:hypothetical protein